MNGNRGENDALQYAIRHTFGVVHAVILTLITFGLIIWFPSLTHWSFTLLGCLILPGLSFLLTCFCTACIQYVCEGKTVGTRILKGAWVPPLGIFIVTLFILPLEMMQSTGVGPLSALMATSIFMNGVTAWLLQVYASSSSESPPPPPTVEKGSEGASPI